MFPVGHGKQQALLYAETLDAPFAFSSNGDGFLLHDRTGITSPTIRELTLDQIPTYDEMFAVYGERIRKVIGYFLAKRIFGYPDL